MLKGEVLPHLVRKQFIKPLKKKTDKEMPNPDVSVVSLNTGNQGTKQFYLYQLEPNIKE